MNSQTYKGLAASKSKFGAAGVVLICNGFQDSSRVSENMHESLVYAKTHYRASRPTGAPEEIAFLPLALKSQQAAKTNKRNYGANPFKIALEAKACRHRHGCSQLRGWRIARKCSQQPRV